MNSVAAEVGIDIAKDNLDISIDGGKPFRIGNDLPDIGRLVLRLPVGSIIHLESSGGYERLPRRLLRAAGFEVRTQDPLKVKRMAQVHGRRGKTDALDAKNLSKVGKDLKAQPEKSQEREALGDLSRAIEKIKSTSAQMKMRAKAPGLDAYTKKMLLQTAGTLTRQVKKMEKEFAKRVKASPLAGRYGLAISVPGVGPCLSRVAVCELPDSIQTYTNAQLTSYAGLAPIDDQSGKSNKPARIQQGNSKIKAALYMPAMYCIRAQGWAKDLYARLRAKGRHHQQAIVAVMRRLLMRILDVLRRGSPWVEKKTEG